MSVPIPSPPTVPFLGNATSIEHDVPLRSFVLLAKQYGDIYKLRIINNEIYMLNSYELLNDVSDEKRFMKRVQGGLAQVRSAAGDGLFTAHAPGEQNWYIAHRLLQPAFGPQKTRAMFDDMTDVTAQLLLKWERYGPQHAIEPTDDFTRLALEAICLCSFGYRLNAFYRAELHPFAVAMADYLAECGHRANRPALVQAVMTGRNAKYEQDQAIMVDLVSDIFESRKRNPVDREDILYTMMFGRDKETGLGLSDQSVKYNILTFLIAGHETTSGLLSFATYHLLKHPEAMRKLREEIDTVIGDRPMTVNDVGKLPYVLAVLRETLRISPSAPQRSAAALEDTIIGGGKYHIAKGATVVINVVMAQRDPKVWGDDADQFRPERMLDGKFEALPPNAWQPFGFGMRGCIGRPFAWQEAQIALISIFQKFDLVLADPSYELELKQTLSIKPLHFHFHAIPRKGKRGLLAQQTRVLSQSEDKHEETPIVQAGDSKQPVYILYGSNTGASEAFAQRLASEAAVHGLRATIGTLDSATEGLPTDGPILIVTASVEGQPTDNAAHFFAWLSNLKGSELTDVKYAVFGCGNRDWAATYQRIPTLIDSYLADHGATRLTPRGEGDASSAEFFDSFDKWEVDAWAALTKTYSTKAAGTESTGLDVKILTGATERATILRQKDAALGTVVANRVVSGPGVPIKRHIEFKLPEDTLYRAGDYLAILPTNPPRDVKRALARFGLLPEQEISISFSGPTSLPTDRPISVFNLLSGYVELSQSATPRDLRILSAAATTSTAAHKLAALTSGYQAEVFAKRLSVLDIVESLPDLELQFGALLALLPAMRLRQYSISSSPLSDPTIASLTISVLEAPALSGRAEPFLGVASTFLSGLSAGDKVQLSVRASNSEFHLPVDPATPLILIGAGSGIAPLRGFLQERAVQKASGREVGASLMFVGCRSPDADFLYSDTDFKEWQDLGIVDIRPAFSRASSESEGCKYVQDRIWHDKAEVLAAWHKGAKFYICGSGKIASSVKGKLLEMIREERQCDEATSKEIFDKIAQGRFATDVFD